MFGVKAIITLISCSGLFVFFMGMSAEPDEIEHYLKGGFGLLILACALHFLVFGGSVKRYW